MSKVGLALVAAAALVVAVVLLALGRREIRVDRARTHTVSGRFMLAVAFFLAVFAAWIWREMPASRAPTDYGFVTCYVRAMQLPARQSVARLAQQLPVLEQTFKDGKIDGVAVDKLLWRTDADLAVLTKEANLYGLDSKERAEAEKIRDAAKAQVERIRRFMKDAPKLNMTN